MVRQPNTVYRGERLAGPAGQVLGVNVTVDDQPLDPRPSRKLADKSPTGFEWGYGGSGPAQLALALVYDATGDRNLSIRSFQWFKWATVSQWGDRWSITAGEIQAWLERFEREEECDTPIVTTAEEGGAL